MSDQNLRAHAMLAESSSAFDQTASMLSMYGMLRSPNAVASGATRATAPPNVQTEVKVISEGRSASASTIWSITGGSSLLR